MEKLILKSESKTMSDNKYALFIGRWQPLHDGHKWLFHQKLKLGEKICIAIRDIAPDDKNWWTAQQVKENIEDFYKSDIEKGNVKVIIIPDIDSVNFGRGVGYDIIEHTPPDNIATISATKIRSELKK